MDDKIKIILDVDTGIDDAVAIALALNEKNLDIKLITTCAGNIDIDAVTHNTLIMVEWFDRGDVPIAKGASKPLKRERNILAVHGGATGMGDYQFKEPHLKPCEENAVDKMYEVLKSSGKATIVCIAPMTNLASLLLKYPEAVQYIERVVFQSGLLADENYPSFNVTTDPEATEIVINSGVPFLICPSDIGHITCLDDDEIKLVELANETGKMFAKTFESFHDRVCKSKVAMHDSCAVALLSRPDLFDIAPARCSIVEKQDTKIFRIKICDKKPNCDCCTSVDIAGFKLYMLNTLRENKFDK